MTRALAVAAFLACSLVAAAPNKPYCITDNDSARPAPRPEPKKPPEPSKPVPEPRPPNEA